jgi:hypothetical protein
LEDDDYFDLETLKAPSSSTPGPSRKRHCSEKTPKAAGNVDEDKTPKASKTPNTPKTPKPRKMPIYSDADTTHEDPPHAKSKGRYDPDAPISLEKAFNIPWQRAPIQTKQLIFSGPCPGVNGVPLNALEALDMFLTQEVIDKLLMETNYNR